MDESNAQPRQAAGFSAPPAQLDLPKVEERILAMWETNGVEATTLHPEGDRPAFVFYDGPPFATGLPHYGHLLAGTIKDVVPRYVRVAKWSPADGARGRASLFHSNGKTRNAWASGSDVAYREP